MSPAAPPALLTSEGKAPDPVSVPSAPRGPGEGDSPWPEDERQGLELWVGASGRHAVWGLLSPGVLPCL